MTAPMLTDSRQRQRSSKAAGDGLDRHELTTTREHGHLMGGLLILAPWLLTLTLALTLDND